MPPKHVLLTGGAGFIGSHLAERLIALGHEVLVLDALTYAGRVENLAAVRDSARFRFVRGDIADAAHVAPLFQQNRFDWVINAAAESHVDRSIEAPAAFLRTNVLGVACLLEHATKSWQSSSDASWRRGFRFLQVSTDEVYGDAEPGVAFTEDSPIHPSSPYSASKAAGDHLVRAWHRTYGLPTLTTHCGNNYGPRQYPEKLIPRALTCALRGEPIPLYGDGFQIRDWIAVEDHCEGLIQTLERGEPGKTYGLGARCERANREVLEMLCAELDRQRPRSDGKPHHSAITAVTDRPGHDRRYAIDPTRAERELGFRPKVDFATGLAKTVSEFVKFHGNP